MNGVATLAAQPDELLAGLWGRICAANGCDVSPLTLNGLQAVLEIPRSFGMVPVVARLLGCSPMEVIHRHTLHQVYRAFSAHVGTPREAEILREASQGRGINMRRESAAMTCPACIAEDREAGRGSYWRRLHHLPGVDWCLLHRVPLVRMAAEAHQWSPMAAMSMLGQTCGDVAAIEPGSVLDRYAGLLVRWMHRTTAMPCEVLNRVVRDGCGMHELRIGQAGKRELVSDLAKRTVPSDWLERHWPEILTKKHAQYVAKLDGVAKDRHVAYTGPSCALVLAVLFDSPEEIDDRLAAAHAAISQSKELHDESLHAAIAAFKQGASLQQAGRAHGVTVGHLERWLRLLAQGTKEAPSVVACS